MASKAKLNVQKFPRPPLLEPISRHIKVTWHGTTIAETNDAYWVLETHHPPTYYIPPSAVKTPLIKTPRQTYCEWKGSATYYSVTPPLAGGDGGQQGSETVQNRIWSYDSPTRQFEPIKGYLSFYASPWECFVDGEKVESQPGDFYGGWLTSDIEGVVKGKNGNFDPVV